MTECVKVYTWRAEHCCTVKSEKALNSSFKHLNRIYKVIHSVNWKTLQTDEVHR